MTRFFQRGGAWVLGQSVLLVVVVLLAVFLRGSDFPLVIIIAGVVLILEGAGVALAGALALIPFFHAKARHEEHWLREKFPEYADYARGVRRFIPWLY